MTDFFFESRDNNNLQIKLAFKSQLPLLYTPSVPGTWLSALHVLMPSEKMQTMHLTCCQAEMGTPHTLVVLSVLAFSC